MALLSQAIKEKENDIRIIERNLAKGHVTVEAVDKLNKSLIDESELADVVNVEELYEGLKGRSSLRA